MVIKNLHPFYSGVLLAVACTFMPFTAWAQAQDVVYNPKLSKEQIAKQRVAGPVPHDAIYGRRLKAGDMKVARQVSARRAAAMKGASQGGSFWGNVTKMGSWEEGVDSSGIYQFSTAQPPVFKLLKMQQYVELSGGAGYDDGSFYAMSLDLSWAQYGIVFQTLYQYDAETWELVGTKDLNDYTLGAMQTAQAQDGTVYGQFYKKGLEGFEYGTIDYKTLKRTTFGTANMPMVAMGITNENKLYGIGSDGNLYQISTTNGHETLIGSTGVAVAKSDGSTYGQSGAVDPVTDKFYWAAIDSAGTCGLYTVDLATGHATKASDFSQGSLQMHGMVAVRQLAAAGAPAKVDTGSVAISFPQGTQIGTVAFTAPTKTFDGNSLTGTLQYEVTVDDSLVSQGSTQAGGKVSAGMTLNEGNHTFCIRTQNAAGKSPKVKLTRYIGFDTPQPATNVVLQADTVQGKMNVTWNKPQASVNGGYLGELTYRVYRCTDGNDSLVADGVRNTAYTDAMGKQKYINVYQYKVETVNNGKASVAASSNYAVVGNELALPYLETFPSEADVEKFTIIDANQDGNTWKFDEDNWDGNSMRVGFASSKVVDDWLITSPVHLKQGVKYRFSLSAWSVLDYPETFEVRLGREATAAAMTQSVIPSTTVGRDRKTYANDAVMVDEDGYYCFGIHGTSNPTEYYMAVDSIAISAGMSLAAPDSVTGLRAEAGAEGALTAKLSFKAPEKNVWGDVLYDNMSVKIARDGVAVDTLLNVAPGATMTWQDNHVPASGLHTYELTPANAYGDGQQASVSPYVGIDTPMAPVLKTTTDAESGKVLITWDEPSAVGTHGGYVKAADISYAITEGILSPFGEILTGDTLVKVKATTSATFNYDTDNGSQGMTYWVVLAKNAAGESGAVAYLMTGAPYSLPFEETFANKKRNYFWIYGASKSKAISLDFADDSYTNDGGTAALTSSEADVAGYMTSGKIALAGAASPLLSFAHKEAQAGNTLSVSIVTPDGVEHNVADAAHSDTFAMKTIDLKAFAGQRYVKVKFAVSYAEAGSCFIDDVRLTEASASGIEAIEGSSADGLKAYTPDGVPVSLGNDGLRGLPKGLYIIRYKDAGGVQRAQKLVVR